MPYVNGSADTWVPNAWRWKPGGEAVFTRRERNGQVWVLRVEAGGYVTQQQAAWLLDAHVTQVNTWARTGDLPSREIGGVSMIPLRAVEVAHRERARR